MNRRRFIAASAAGLAASALPAHAQRFQPPQDVAPLIEKITGGVAPTPGGKSFVTTQGSSTIAASAGTDATMTHLKKLMSMPASRTS